MQITQIKLHLEKNTDLDELILKYNINEKNYERTFYKKEHSGKKGAKEIEKQATQILQKELLYYLLLTTKDFE